MKKHEFKDGDGMSPKTSTAQERQAIHKILEAKGYNLYKQTADRHPTDWKASFAFNSFIGSLSWMTVDYVTNDHTYKEMLEILHRPGCWYSLVGSTPDFPPKRRDDIYNWEPNTIAGAFSISKELLKEKGLKIDSNGKIVEAIPTIELKGIRKDINFLAKDGNGDVYFYDSKPTPSENMWTRSIYYSAECLDQSIFKDLECLDWNKSLHKVIHA